jgi:hypothetical protein
MEWVMSNMCSLILFLFFPFFFTAYWATIYTYHSLCYIYVAFVVIYLDQRTGNLLLAVTDNDDEGSDVISQRVGTLLMVDVRT